MTPEQRAFPNHEHTSSVYVRCKECLTFGVPMPGEFVCGNCRSNNTVSLLPTCCIKAAEDSVRLEANERGAYAEMDGHQIGFREAYEKGFAEAKEMAAKTCQEWSGEEVRYAKWQEVAKAIHALRPPARGKWEKV